MKVSSYSQKYRANNKIQLYPVEFVIRAFLGTYPDLKLSKESFQGKRILDLGYGDGRNMSLLKDLGFEIHGVEMSEEINRHVRLRLARLGIKAELKVGANARIPYGDNFFKVVLACHSSYYVEKGDTFDRNLAEISRVIEPGGIWVTSLPMKDTYILKGAKKLSGGHYEITKDPYGLRKGVVFRAFGSEKEVRKTLSPYFHELRIGFCDDMYWGIHQKVWIVVGRKLKNKKRGYHVK